MATTPDKARTPIHAGLASNSAAERIDIDENGDVVGLS